MSLLCVSGAVSEADGPALLGAVQAALVDQPCGVVVDLSQAGPLDDAVVEALREAAQSAGTWPRAALVFCAAAPDVVARLATSPVYEDRAAAVAHLDDRADETRECVALRHSLEGPAQARAVVAALSERLHLEDVSDDVALVVSEMVTNAVRHASPPVALEIRADADQVLIAVRDGTPDEPSPRDAPVDAEGGRGLLLVDLLSDQHGVRADPPGKTVWAALTRRRPTGS